MLDLGMQNPFSLTWMETSAARTARAPSRSLPGPVVARGCRGRKARPGRRVCQVRQVRPARPVWTVRQVRPVRKARPVRRVRPGRLVRQVQPD
jgi:hypothetical protein